MHLRHRFLTSLRTLQRPAQELAPELMTAAAAEALGASGATLRLLPPLLRLPLGSSDPVASVAEQVQVTFGGGPGVGSGHRGGPVLAVEADLVERWQVFHHGLVARTPYRSVLSLPLTRGGGHVFAALDVYSTDPAWRPEPCEVVQSELGDLVSMLVLANGARVGGLLPSGSEDWAGRRRQAWIAVGMLCAVTGVSEVDAVALLRGNACSAGRLLDEVADDVVRGRIGVQTLVH